ncbi:MAG: PhoU domain-containing protein [Promethearchaeota archaeon]
MNGVETRKIQLTGGATYIVSLPKRWAERAGLKPGSDVQLIPQDQHSIVIQTAASLEGAELSKSRMSVDARTPTEDIVRDFITQYLAGFDIIQIDLTQAPADKRMPIKNAIRSLLIGVEVINETTDNLTIQCFLGPASLPFLNAFDRMEVLVRSMQTDAVTALITRDKKLAEEVVQRDTEIDRFYFYIVRQLTVAVDRRELIQKIGLSSPRACLDYRQAVKSIERAGDHATRLAELAASLALAPDTGHPPALLKMHERAESIFQDALESLRILDVPLAHRTIRRVREVADLEEHGIRTLLSGEYSIEAVIPLRLAFESLRRIAEYGSDIAEIAINLSVER